MIYNINTSRETDTSREKQYFYVSGKNEANTEEATLRVESSCL